MVILKMIIVHKKDLDILHLLLQPLLLLEHLLLNNKIMLLHILLDKMFYNPLLLHLLLL